MIWLFVSLFSIVVYWTILFLDSFVFLSNSSLFFSFILVSYHSWIYLSRKLIIIFHSLLYLIILEFIYQENSSFFSIHSCILSFLNLSVTTGQAGVEEACVEMVLQLSPLQPRLAFTVLHAWYTTRGRKRVPKHLKDRIVALRNIIKSRLPHLKLQAFY